MDETPRRPKKRTHITGIVYPIEDMELYKRNLGLVMLDIMEKQLGTELFELSMKELERKVNEEKDKKAE